MNVNIFTGFYVDENKSRNAELKFCINKNVSAGINLVFLLESKHLKALPDSFCIYFKFPFEHRPTFNDFFEAASLPFFANDINIISNSDIFFEDIESLIQYPFSEKDCLALSRWDYHFNSKPTPFHRSDSQDSWIFKGVPKIKLEEDFCMGIPGCDNRIAYEINKAGYNSINPCSVIKSYHVHESNIRNYLDDNGNRKDVVPPPYLLVNPQ